jgi:hypothetical protein
MHHMRTRLAFISALALFCAVAQADQKSVPAEFPFEFSEGMLWLKVHSPASVEPLNFLLDSGAGASVINLSTAKRLGLRLARPIEVQGVGSATTGYFPQRLSASVAGVPLPNHYVAVDLDQLSDACHCNVDGLIGVDFFRDRIVQIDFESRTIRLLTPGAVLSGQTLPLKTNGKALTTPVSVNGRQNQWVRVDTGCASALQWVADATSPKTGTTRVAVALKEISLDTVPASLAIGQTTFPKISAEVHRQPLFNGEDGLLGNAVLSRFRSITIDARAGRIAFQSAREH